jgi:predicted transcriptional regulator
MSERETMTLNLRPAEMRVVEQIAADTDLSKTAVIRQALRLYQLTRDRLKAGEVCTWSGDRERQMLFVGIGFPATPTTKAEA